jgi:hypothetical protein
VQRAGRRNVVPDFETEQAIELDCPLDVGNVDHRNDSADGKSRHDPSGKPLEKNKPGGIPK